MPLRRLLLALPDRPDRRVLLAALRALGRFIDLVEAALVERVFAEKVYRRQVQVAAAGRTPARLEHDGFGGEFVEFLALGVGFGAVDFDVAAVLREGLVKNLMVG